MIITKYIKSAYSRATIAEVIPPGVKVSIAYTDNDSGEYIREASGYEADVETFRASIGGIYVNKPAPIIDPVSFMMLFPTASRVALRSSTDPVIADFLRMLDDTRLTTVDRNKTGVIEAIDYVSTAANLTQDEIERVKTGQ
jgi:hypothetical protein